MIERTKQFITHPLISGSTIVFVGSFAANVINYIYNLAMGRMLRVEEYGLLLSLSSMFILLAVFNTAYGNIFTKFAAQYFTAKNNQGIKSLYTVGFKVIGVSALLMLLLLLVLTKPIMSFLHVSDPLLVLGVSFAVFGSFLYAMPGGILQGRMRFVSVTSLAILQPIIKLVIGASLIYLGYAVFGAVVGITLSSLGVMVIGFLLILRSYPKEHTKEVHTDFVKEFRKYSYPVFLASIGITLLSNTDILLVRHLFSETVSGQYAALSLMGKAIFYFTTPINSVFFPLIAQKKARKERLLTIVLLTVGLVSLASLSLSFVYFVFPQFVLSVFFPSPSYSVLAGYLGIFSLYIFMFSLMNIFNTFFLSIGRTEVFWFTLIGGILQVVLILLFHGSLFTVIIDLFVVSLLLLAAFLVYYLKHGRD